jgi:hypothetical protein
MAATVRILGVNFTLRSQVEWNGALLKPTYISTTELQVILAADSELTAEPGLANLRIYEQRCTEANQAYCALYPDLYSNLVTVPIQAPAASVCSLFFTVGGGFNGMAYKDYSATVVLQGGARPYSIITTPYAEAALNQAGIQLTHPTDDTLLIAGTPILAGRYKLPLSGRDQNGCIANQEVEIVIGDGVVLLTQQLAEACVGNPYTQLLEAAGGVAPYKWYITAGGLPGGIKLDRDKGILSGTPAKPSGDQASWTFFPKIQVDDSAPVPSTADLVFPMTLYPALVIATDRVEDATIGVDYSQTFAAAGCVGPYQWTLDSASLRLNGQSITPSQLRDQVGLVFSEPEAALSATPSKRGGTVDFAVRVTDLTGGTARKEFRLNIVEPRLVVPTSSLPDGTVSLPYSQKLQVQNGAAPYAWKTTGSLPDGLTLPDAPQSSAEVEITGSPRKAGTFKFQVSVTDRDGFKTPGPKELQIRIAEAPVSAPVVNRVEASGRILPNVIEDPEGQVRVQVRIKNGYKNLALSGTLSVNRFEPAQGIPADGDFASAYQLVRLAVAGTGKSIDFEVPAGGEVAQFLLPAAAGKPAVRQDFIELQTGNVAGDITLGISRLAVTGIDITPQPVASTRLTIPTLPPKITGLCAAKQPGVSLQVMIIGYSTARDLLQAEFTLSGNGLSGVAPLTSKDLDAQLRAWYGSPVATNFGSSFILKESIPVSGSLDGISSVSVTLRKKDSPETATSSLDLSTGCGFQ